MKKSRTVIPCDEYHQLSLHASSVWGIHQMIAVDPLRRYNYVNMSALLDDLQKQARGLTPREKVTLARMLIEQLDPSLDVEVEELWIAEAQRRYQAFLNGELQALPGDDVMTRARNRLQ
jgi:putative addiction module component (TIGR02574 family)